MAKNKTIQTDESVYTFLSAIEDETKSADCFKIAELMKSQTGFEPAMWGPAIVGFGSYHYKYESGREGDAPLAAFSPRKAAIVLYLSSKFDNREELLKKFGKHKTGKGCIYIKKLEDIYTDVLKQMVTLSVKKTKSLYK